MNIRNILLWSLVIAFVSVTSVMVFSNSTSSLHEDYHRISTEIIAGLMVTETVDREFQVLNNLVVDTYDYNDLVSSEELHSEFSRLLTSVNTKVEQLTQVLKHAESVERGDLLVDVNVLMEDIREWALLSKIVVGIEQSSIIPAQFHVENKSYEIQADLRNIVEYYQSVLLEASAQSKDKFESIFWIQLIAYFILVGICIYFALRNTKNILDSLVGLKGVMSSLAAGDLSVEMPNRKYSGDIADISNSVLHFKDSMVRLQTANNTIKNLANRDYLTGLGNRRGLYEFVNSKLSDSSIKPFWVVQIDLNKFKSVNDVFGHMAGDTVLKIISDRILTSLGESEYVARMGGDEFVVVLDDIGILQAITNVERLESLIVDDVDFENRKLNVGASIGIAHYPSQSTDIDELLRLSDLALYEMKGSAVRNIYFVNEKLIQTDARKKRLAREIPKALAEGQFCAYFQPKIALPDYELMGFEALVRWVHPENGVLTPVNFLDEIESAGLNIEIGRLMISCAIQALENWATKGYEKIAISINVSEQELLNPSYADYIIQRVNESNIDSSSIALEVLETTVIRDDKTVISMNLLKLREAGFEIHIDDFGVGYSSATSVIQTSFDTMKIDKSLVCTVESGESAKKVFKSMIDLAKELNMKSCVEGVETQAELDMVIEYGADMVQGYFFCKPQSYEKSTEYLSEHYLARSAELNKLVG